MVLYRNHLKDAGGEPRDYGQDMTDPPRSKSPRHESNTSHPRTKKMSDAGRFFAMSPRHSTSSRKRRSRHNNNSPQSPRIVSAYDVTLLVRSQNPTADAHDPNLRTHDLPDHHVPSFVSVASKAIQRQGHSGSYFSRQRSKLMAKKNSEATKSTSNLPPAYLRSGGSKRFAQPAASQSEFSKSSLPLLSFQNPWNSFQPPNLANVWQGLKWGLPEGYEEGGHGKYRGGGRHSSRLQQHDQALEAELGTGWNDVQVQTPNWGWTASERDTWLQGPNVAKEREEDSKNLARDSTSPAFGRRKEWQDPRSDEPANHARVAWLGHATTLLQLPPLADPITIQTDPSVEGTPGQTQGGVQDKDTSARIAQQLVSQVSDIRPEQTQSKMDRQKKIVIKDPPRARGEEKSGQTKGANSQPDGLPMTSSSNMDDIPSESSDESDDDDDEEEGEEEQAPEAARKNTSRDQIIDDTRDRSINILFDPIFSKRCSPSQTLGPVRFTEPPCQVEDLPPIDLILLSHDHYDHSDVESLKKILDRRGQAVHLLVGLGNKDWLVSSCGFRRSQISELDWWDEAILTASGSPVEPGDQARAALRIICTPAQHGSGRVPGGKDSTLWCSWMIETITPAKVSDDEHAAPASPRQDRWRAFFAGDTGLRRHGEKFTNRKSPVCPAFEEAAKRYGTPHLFLLPISIGSSLSYLRSKDPFPRRYSPFPRVSESLTSCIHMDAEDAVTMMELMTGYPPLDRKDATEAQGNRQPEHSGGTGGSSQSITPSQQQQKPISPVALAVHYGTFVRNKEQTKADVRNLQSACKRHGVTFARTSEGRYHSGGDEHRASGHADPTAVQKGSKAKGHFLVAHQGETVWIKI